MSNQSSLTVERPDIWQRALVLATVTTGMTYAAKLPLSDGTIYACGGYEPEPTDEECYRDDILIRKKTIKRIRELEKGAEPEFEEELVWRRDELLKDVEDRILEYEKANPTKVKKKPTKGSKASAVVVVPEGAAEWLLHEVGHWVSATPEERSLQNYGLGPEEYEHGADREWQAWAFEEMVLAPWGPARLLTAPTMRDGVGFSRSGPIPASALRHVERQVAELGLDIEAFRAVYGGWVQWGRSRGHGRAPWESVQ